MVEHMLMEPRKERHKRSNVLIDGISACAALALVLIPSRGRRGRDLSPHTTWQLYLV